MVTESEISWDKLETNEEFDSEDVQDSAMSRSTQLVGNIHAGEDKFLVNTPVSLLVQSLIHQLCSLLENDHNRATSLYDSICLKLHEMKLLDKTYAMGEFEFIRSQYQTALQQLVKVVNGNDKLPLASSQTQSSLTWSRYRRDFEEVKFIAKGGFGNVFMARHRLDGVEYAIKKICMQSSDLKSVLNHLKEVKTFAALDHPNIVSYKSAWLEPLLEKKEDNDQESKGGSSVEYSSSYLSKNNSSESLSKKTHEESDFQVSFQYSNEHKEIATRTTSSATVSESIENCKALCKLDDSNKQMRLVFEPTYLNLKWATLYIQMSLCEKTMKTWLEERNQLILSNLESPPIVSNSCFPNPTAIYMDTVIDIFNQLSSGLHYIHGRNIIHHDIKPSNIFIGCQGVTRNVRLGDFGLACPLQKSHKGIAIGTKLYAAPEQLKGECNSKSDLYSIGLIFLEMIESFGTEMEKVERLNELRDGKIPAHVTAYYPKQAHIISKLVQLKTEKRIDTSQLLQLLDELRENKDETIRSMRDEICTLRNEAISLRNDVKERDEEILRLRKLLGDISVIPSSN